MRPLWSELSACTPLISTLWSWTLPVLRESRSLATVPISRSLMSLTEAQKELAAQKRATLTAMKALQSIMDLHITNKESQGLSVCMLCFRNWPCETHRFAEAALSKMKGQLSR